MLLFTLRDCRQPMPSFRPARQPDRRYPPTALRKRMILVESLHSLRQHRIKFFPHSGCTSPYPLLFTSGGGKSNTAHAIVHQFAKQLTTAHSAISDSEEETVANGLRHVIVVDNMETVFHKICFIFSARRAYSRMSSTKLSSPSVDNRNISA